MTRSHHSARTTTIESLEDRRLLSGSSIFFDNFETGGPGWTVDTSLGIDTRNPWTIGAVSGGPGVAKSGTKVAATTRPGNDAYLASPVINLPSVNQYTEHLYLRYWQWANFSATGGFAADTASVREWVPELGTWGPWNVIDPNTETVPQVTKTWGYVGLDLTQFSGSRVQIGFHNYGSLNGAPGWYIDDVDVRRESVQNPWASDTAFENGFNGWSTTSGMWDIGTPNNGLVSPDHGKMAGTGLATTPVAGFTSSLISPAFYLPKNTANSPVTLSFNSYTDIASSTIMTVEWQYWMPSVGWSPVQNISADGIDTVLTGYQPGGQWKTFHLPLTQSLSGAFQLPVRLLFTAGAGVSNARGWFIDDVSLQFPGKPVVTAHPTIVVSNPYGTLTDRVTSVLWGSHNKGTGPSDITFTIRNTGNATLSVGSVFLDNNVGFSVLKQPATSVVAGGSTTFTLRMSTALAGNESAAVRFADNDPVANPFNFKISGTVVGGTAYILGTVFNDANLNNTPNAGEGLAGWRVFIDANKNGIFDAGELSTLTNSVGAYRFDTLAAGSYQVREVIPTGWKRIAPSLGYWTANLTAGKVLSGINFENRKA